MWSRHSGSGCDQKFINIKYTPPKLHYSNSTLANVTIMGAYVYAIFSMIAAGMYLHTLKTKPIIVFVQSLLLFVQVSFQGKTNLFTKCPFTY